MVAVQNRAADQQQRIVLRAVHAVLRFVLRHRVVHGRVHAVPFVIDLHERPHMQFRCVLGVLIDARDQDAGDVQTVQNGLERSGIALADRLAAHKRAVGIANQGDIFLLAGVFQPIGDVVGQVVVRRAHHSGVFRFPGFRFFRLAGLYNRRQRGLIFLDCRVDLALA